MVTFSDKVTKILRNLCLHFARQDGQDGKKQKENHATKVTKIPKTKRQKYGMIETDINVQLTKDLKNILLRFASDSNPSQVSKNVTEALS